MSYVVNSHPEPAPGSTHANRVAYLTALRERIATMPDPQREPLISCPQCSSALSVRQGRASRKWFISHDRTNCEYDRQLWIATGTDRDEALGALRDLLDNEPF